MELKMADCKPVSSDKMLLSTFLSSKHTRVGVRFIPHSCSCKGTIPKATYSSSWNNVTSSVKQERFTSDSSSSTYVMNGRNGSSVFPRVSRVLEAVDDAYGGVLIDPESLPANPNMFSFMIRSSLSHWKMKGKKGVWLKLPLAKSELVPVAVQEGFEYHHAERDYVMMTYWIPDGPCMLPSNASHQVGVGGFVINDKDEVLVVQEKHYAPELAGLWKLPTGFILESEEIYEGVVREVKEETGVDTEFVEVIAFRHAQNVAFEKSDLFFVCMLRPLSTKIMVDDLEIEAAKWMPLHEFVSQPLIQGDMMFRKVSDICIAKLGKCYCGLSVHQLVSKFDGRLSSLYFNTVEDQDDSICQAN